MVDAPHTEEGWFVLHDFYEVDWDAWRDAPERDRETALEEAESFLAHREALAGAGKRPAGDASSEGQRPSDQSSGLRGSEAASNGTAEPSPGPREDGEAASSADEGDSAVFSITGHEADLMFVHFRESLDAVERIERQFEVTAFAEYTEHANSYVSVTEISGYTSPEYFEDPESVDEGLRRYMEGKLTPEIPEDTYVSFYPMSKRRQPGQNWYDLPLEERVDLMAGHGEVGKQYAGRIQQVIASSVGLDDWEWGVTLFADDLTDVKDIVYEMRFDEASSKYGEFGSFYVGRRFPPEDLPAYMAGEAVPTPEGGHAHGEDGHHHGDTPEGGDEEHDKEDTQDLRGELEDLDIYAGQPHGEDVYATVLYSEADADDLFEEVDGLRSNFEHYDTHVKTVVYDGRATDRRAVVSIWETASAADTAAGFLSELPEVVSRAGEESGFGTMGMFYETNPEHTGDFVEKFDTVADVLADMDGHFETDLMVNVEDENDMFIASQWASKDDAMAFFRSEAFSDTVDWGRDVLADRPRHVFLA